MTKGGTLDILLRGRKSILLRSRESPEVATNPALARLLDAFELYSIAVSPLVHEGALIGVLLAGYHSVQHMGTHDARVIESLLNTASDRMATGRLEQLDDKEHMVFHSITNLAGDALVRVMMFTDMERQIDLRAEQLRRTHEDLLKTREIVIQVEKLSSLGRMAAGVIHEINDPLNFLMNILPDLRRDFEGLAKAKSLAVRATRGTLAEARVAEIIRTYDIDAHLDELDFVFDRAQEALGKSARIAHGLQVFAQGGKAAVQRCDLIEVVRQTLALIPKKTKGDVVIDVQTAPVFWDVNSDRMAQVCMNLIINALGAMVGVGKLTVSGESGPRSAILRFRDTGPGIPAAVQSKIFDPFFTTKPAGKSTGLGLTICAEIVREYGGRFELESSPGKGTCFSIIFTEEQRVAFASQSA